MTHSSNYNTPVLQNTVKAVCRNRNGDLLLLRKCYENGEERFTLPGGTQEPGEPLIQTLQRECEEEINCRVEVGQLHYVLEHLKPARPEKPPRHKVEFGFTCTVPASYQPGMGHNPDPHQVGVLWVPADRLSSLQLTPEGVGALIEHEGAITCSACQFMGL